MRAAHLALVGDKQVQIGASHTAAGTKPSALTWKNQPHSAGDSPTLYQSHDAIGANQQTTADKAPSEPYLVSLSHLTDARGLNEVRQHERWLLNTPFALQVLPLLTPMPGHRYTVPVRLHQQQGSVYAKLAVVSTN